MTDKTLITGIEALFMGALALLMGLPTAFRLLVILQIVDVLMGLIAAQKRSELRSALAWRGWAKKFAAWLMVIVVYEFQVDAAGMVIKESPVPSLSLASLAAVGFAVAESLSILENAQKAGLWIPQFVSDSLAQTRDMIFGVNDDGPD